MFIVYLVVFGGVACLFPLAFYCLLLASWNGRRRPMFVGGPADFAGVILATSGFLIAGGPLILFGLHEYSLREGEYPKFVSAWSALASPSWLWLSAWAGYFLAVVGGLTWLLIRRRPISVIYNIDEADAEELLPSTLDRMGLAWAARGPQYWVETPRPDGLRRTMVEVTIAPILRNMTLRWLATPGEIRWEIEREVRRQLAQIVSPRNPLSGWLLTAAVALFGLLFMVLGWFLALFVRLRA